MNLVCEVYFNFCKIFQLVQNVFQFLRIISEGFVEDENE